MDYRIDIDGKEFVKLSGEETGETASAGTESNVFTFGKPQMSTGEMFMNAGTVILVVFGVLFIMYLLISLAGRILAAATKDSGKSEAKSAVPAAQTAPAPASAAQTAEET